MAEQGSHVVDTAEDVDPDAVFAEGRDQAVLAIRISPVFGQIDLTLLTSVIDAANERGFALSRETSFREEWLLCVFEAYDEV